MEESKKKTRINNDKKIPEKISIQKIPENRGCQKFLKLLEHLENLSIINLIPMKCLKHSDEIPDFFLQVWQQCQKI